MKTILLVASSLLTIGAFSQTVEWAKTWGGTHPDGAFATFTDQSGNVFVAGTFRGNVDFDPGPETFEVFGAGLYDAYIHKMDAEGNLIWVRSFSGAGLIHISDIALDDDGNIYATGMFSDSVDFDSGSGQYHLASNGLDDFYLLKLNQNGNTIFARSWGGSSSDGSYSMAMDSDGHLLLSGYFQETVDFDGGGVTFELTSNGVDDAFITKLDGNGNLIWAKQLGGIGYDWARNIDTDDENNVYITGVFQGTVDFDPGDEVHEMVPQGSFGSFLCKLDEEGNFVRADNFKNVNMMSVTDNAGNLYLFGSFTDVFDVDLGVETFELISQGSEDAYIAKFDAESNLLWASSWGGDGIDRISDIALDQDDRIYIVGSFEGTADFNPGTNSFELTAYGEYDAYLNVLDGSGNFVAAFHWGGTEDDFANGIDLYGDELAYIIGEFSASVDFDWGGELLEFSSNGGRDAYVQKVNLEEIVGVEDRAVEVFSVYPNPTANQITIRTSNGIDGRVEVYNIVGQKIKTEKIQGTLTTLPLDGPQGVYFINLVSSDNSGIVKVVKH